MNTRHLRLGLALACLFALATLPLHAGEGEELPFSVARVFFQLNDTDGDLGFHAVIDGDPWKSLVKTRC